MTHRRDIPSWGPSPALGLIVTGLVLLIAALITAEVGAFFFFSPDLLHTFSIPVHPHWALAHGRRSGLWLFIGALRGRYNLLISGSARKPQDFLFGAGTDIKDILHLSRSEWELGYDIDLSIKETSALKDLPADNSVHNANSNSIILHPVPARAPSPISSAPYLTDPFSLLLRRRQDNGQMTGGVTAKAYYRFQHKYNISMYEDRKQTHHFK